MKLGIRLPVSGPFASRDAIRAVALKAEESRYDFVTVYDHLSWNDKHHFSAGTIEAADKSPNPIDFYEAFTTLSVVAGFTNRINLIPIAIVLPYRSPIILAKQCATLSCLSEDRFTPCFCIGAFKNDFDALGLPYERRGKITDEYLLAVKKIVTTDEKRFSGTYVNFEDCDFFPKVKDFRMWIGGFTPRTFDRVAKYGNGWAAALSAKQFVERTAQLRKVMKEHNRSDVEDVSVCQISYVSIASSEEEAMKLGLKSIEAYGNSSRVKTNVYSGGLLDDISRIGMIGTPTQIIQMITEFEKSGVTHMELKFISNTLSEMLEKIDYFTDEVFRKMYA